MTKSTNNRSRATYDVLMLDARYRQSLATIRSLGRHGLCVAAADTIPTAPGFSSRWCADRFLVKYMGTIPMRTPMSTWRLSKSC